MDPDWRSRRIKLPPPTITRNQRTRDDSRRRIVAEPVENNVVLGMGTWAAASGLARRHRITYCRVGVSHESHLVNCVVADRPLKTRRSPADALLALYDEESNLAARMTQPRFTSIFKISACDCCWFTSEMAALTIAMSLDAFARDDSEAARSMPSSWAARRCSRMEAATPPSS